MAMVDTAPSIPPQVSVQLWTPERKAKRRHLAPCVHLIELERQSRGPNSPSPDQHHTHNNNSAPLAHHPPQSDATHQGRVASLLDISAHAILIHQHRHARGDQEATTKNSSSLAQNAPSTPHYRDGEGSEPSLDLARLPCELRTYLGEHWMCVVCQRPTRDQQSSEHHNNGGRSGANYPGWCRSCVQRLCYCQVDGCQACNSTWMCLTCGKVCCSTSSHEHSFDHSMIENHMLAWKVGPKAFGEDADTSDPGIWCFACSRYVGQTQLPRHLQALGFALAPTRSSGAASTSTSTSVAVAISPCLEQRR